MTAKYANQVGYSDVNPYEVIRECTSRKIIVRRMSTNLITPAKMLGLGGFSAVFDNSTQKWECVSNKNYPEIAIRFSKKRNGWYDKFNNKYSLNDVPVKIYDYNF